VESPPVFIEYREFIRPALMPRIITFRLKELSLLKIRSGHDCKAG
jgi:hypothetical protein